MMFKLLIGFWICGFERRVKDCVGFGFRWCGCIVENWMLVN